MVGIFSIVNVSVFFLAGANIRIISDIPKYLAIFVQQKAQSLYLIVASILSQVRVLYDVKDIKSAVPYDAAPQSVIMSLCQSVIYEDSTVKNKGKIE